MNVQFKKDGYIVKILTWGMPRWKRVSYLRGIQNGCPMFWRFLFMFVWSLGGWREDHVEAPFGEAKPPKKVNKTIARINEKVFEFSETKAAQRIGKGFGMLIATVLALVLGGIVLLLVFAIGKGILALFAGGLAAAKGLAIGIGILATAGTVLYLLVKGIAMLVRFIGSTEVWALFVEKVKSLKQKTCPAVSFV